MHGILNVFVYGKLKKNLYILVVYMPWRLHLQWMKLENFLFKLDDHSGEIMECNNDIISDVKLIVVDQHMAYTY
jgi:hypothetical protein